MPYLKSVLGVSMHGLLYGHVFFTFSFIGSTMYASLLSPEAIYEAYLSTISALKINHFSFLTW